MSSRGMIIDELPVGEAGGNSASSPTGSLSLIRPLGHEKRSRLQMEDRTTCDERPASPPRKMQRYPVTTVPFDLQASEADKPRLKHYRPLRTPADSKSPTPGVERLNSTSSSQVGIRRAPTGSQIAGEETPLQSNKHMLDRKQEHKQSISAAPTSAYAVNIPSAPQQGEVAMGDMAVKTQDLYWDVENHQANLKRLKERMEQNQRDVGRLLIEANRCQKAADARIKTIREDEVLASDEQAMYEQKRDQLRILMKNGSPRPQPS